MYDNSEQDGEKSKGLKFSSNISLGQTLQVGAIIIATVVWAATASNKADQTAQDVKDIKTTFSTQLSGLQSTIDSRLQSIQQQIQSLPTYGARIDQLEKSQAQQDSNINGLDIRLRSVENQTAIDNSRIQNIERASSVPLGGGGGRQPNR